MAMPWQLLVPRIPSHGQPSELMRSIELRRVIYWPAVAAIAVLFAYLPATALTPAAIATKRSMRRKNTTATAAKRLAACKLRLELGGLPDINEPFPSKPKWTRRKTYQRIRNEIQALEAKAKTRRFRKPIATQLFTYHVA
jgi:hypothetical protein